MYFSHNNVNWEGSGIKEAGYLCSIVVGLFKGDFVVNEPKIHFGALPKKMQILIIVLAAIAVPILCWSGWDMIRFEPGNGWILLMIFALLTLPLSIFLPSIEATVSFRYQGLGQKFT
jgi:hypothetical protein